MDNPGDDIKIICKMTTKNRNYSIAETLEILYEQPHAGLDSDPSLIRAYWSIIKSF
jgi:hypothetical protein